MRAVLLPSAGKPGRRRLRSWHGATGLWIAAGLLFLSATGLTWSLHAGANITDLRSSWDWTTPSVSSASRSPGDVGWQAVRDATARAGLSDPVEIRPPSDGGYVVQQVGRGWPSKQDSMSVDPGTGKITGTLKFADYPLAAKLSRWGIDAHMGLLFGVANQVALTVLGAALVCVVLWGYRMWWLRGRSGRSRGGSRFGRMPVRGTWRRIPGRVLAPALVGLAVAGWFLPVFGVSLLGFLAVDCLLGLRRETAR